MKPLFIAAVLLFAFSAAPCVAQEEPMFDNWIATALWPEFKRTPEMIDNCALRISHETTFDASTGWPAYCVDFRDTEPVVSRVAELTRGIAAQPKKARAK